MHARPVIRTVAAWLTFAALGTPAAIARPADLRAPHVSNHEAPTAVTAARSGFDWGSAGVGAGATLGVIAVSLGGALAVGPRSGRRSRSALGR
jgi:hypothetical protein